MAKQKAVTARRRTTVVTDEVGNGDEIPVGNGADHDTPTQGDALGELLGLASDGSVFKAYKKPEKAGEREAYAGSYSKEELSLDAIRDVYGGGTYRITEFDRAGRYANTRTVTILGLPKAPAAPQGAANSSLAETMLLKMMEQQTQLMAAIAARPQAEQKQPTVMEMIQLIKAMEPKHESSVDTLLKGIALAKDLGGGGGEPGMMDVAMKGLTALTAAAEASKSAIPNPQPVATPTAPRLPNPKEPQDMNLILQMKRLNWLKATVAVLIGHAARNKDPQLYADVFVDNIPDFVDEAELLEQFEQPGALDTLAQLAPDVKKYAPWFEKFRAAVLEAYSDDAEQPDALSSVESGGTETPN